MAAAAKPVITAKTGRSPQAPPSPALSSPPELEQCPDVLFAVGVSLLFKESFSEAAAIFKKLLQQQPDHARALLCMGQILLVSGRIDDALDYCNRALTLDYLLPSGYYLRGLIYEMHEMEQESFSEYRKAILLEMDFVMPHYQLGKLCFRCGDHKSGLRELKNSLKLLEKSGRESVVPFSRGLSREVFIGQLRDEIQRVETVMAREAA